MIAIIPARGGSKGLPGKNIKLFNEKPLIAYTIEAALKAKHISQVIVSTDDDEIREVSIAYGAKVPFLRPKNLAGDNSKAIDAYLYTIERLNSEFSMNTENFVVLLPTAPLRTHKHIDEAIDLFMLKKADSVISLTEAQHPPSWYKRIDVNGVIHDYFDDNDNSLNRQEITQTFIPNGAIYIFKYSILKGLMTYYTNKTFAYLMDEHSSIDIDTQVQFDFAEFLMKKGKKL